MFEWRFVCYDDTDATEHDVRTWSSAEADDAKQRARRFYLDYADLLMDGYTIKLFKRTVLTSAWQEQM